MPVSSQAILARGIRILLAAIAASKKILSTCSCVKEANFFCASRIEAIFA